MPIAVKMAATPVQQPGTFRNELEFRKAMQLAESRNTRPRLEELTFTNAHD